VSAEAERVFIDFSVRKLRQLAERIVQCLDRLDEEEVWARGGNHENAVGNLLLHLAGNVRQWILSGVGGAPDTRQRDSEFAARGSLSKAELVSQLTETVNEAAAVLESLPPGRLTQSMSPQGYQVTLLEGIYHVVEHFAQHTGQIIYVTKMFTGRDLEFYKHLSGPGAHSEKTP